MIQRARSTALATVLTGLALAGCGNPHNVTVPTDIDKISTISGDVKKLPQDEQELFAGYVMRHTLGAAFGKAIGVDSEGIRPGITVGQAIEEQRQFLEKEKASEAAEKALKEKLAKERAQAEEAMRSAAIVTIVSKKISQKVINGMELDRNIDVVFGFKNNTDKEIAGIKGTLEVLDIFGDKLSAFGIAYDSTLKPGASATWTGTRSVKYTMGDNNDEKFAGLADDKYKVVWKPDAIIFGDGTKLEPPAK